MQDQPTLGVGTVIDVFHELLAQGVEATELLDTCEITQAQLDNPDTRIPASALPKIWDLALNRSMNPAIGLQVASNVAPERLSIVAQAFFQSETLRQGLEQYIRFSRLVNESIDIVFQEGKQVSKLIFKVEPEYYHRSELERTLASAFARAEYFLKQAINTKVKEVSFQHDAPEYADQYEAIFKTNLRFNKAETSIAFDNSLLDYRIKNRNPYLFDALTNHAESLLKRLGTRSSLKSKVYRFIKNNLAHDDLDVLMAAEHLHISRHTLYRKLKKEGLSFQTMVEQVRQEKSQELLKNKDLSVSEVAFLLGFSELSAFSRAFKRWTGSSPAHFRQNLVSAEASI